MKPATFLFWLLCTAVFFGGGQAHAVVSLPAKHAFSSPVKPPVAFAAHAKAIPAGTAPDSVDIESIIAVDDDDDDQHHIGKQVPVITCYDLVFVLHALPPPVRALANGLEFPQHTSFLRSCRYLAHRALLI